MEDKLYCVYIHINKINNKKYVGITSQNPKNRWQNGLGYRKNSHFFRSICYYGWDNFKHLIIAKDLSAEIAGDIEKSLIKYFNTTDWHYGYNIAEGGIINDNFSKRIKGEKVVCDNKIFNSITECAKYYNVQRMTLTQWLDGKYATPLFFVEKELSYYGYDPNYQKRLPYRKKVFFDNKIYSSATKLAKDLNIDKSTVNKWLLGKNKMPPEIEAKQLHYIEDVDYIACPIKL